MSLLTRRDYDFKALFPTNLENLPVPKVLAEVVNLFARCVGFANESSTMNKEN